MANGYRRRRSGGGRSSSGRSAGAGRARGGPARGGARYRGGGGGGNNAMPMVVGIVAVVAVVAVIVAMGGKKAKKKEAWVSDEVTADTPVDKGANVPAVRKKSPPPKIPDDILEAAKAIVAEMVPDREKGDALYDEAMRAKQSGDRDTWQAKLKEAAPYYANIRERWNDEIIGEIVAAIPESDDWDAENVANYWLGKEGSKVAKAIERLAFIKKQLGVN